MKTIELPFDPSEIVIDGLLAAVGVFCDTIAGMPWWVFAIIIVAVIVRAGGWAAPARRRPRRSRNSW